MVRKWTAVVALSGILTAAVVLLRYDQPPAKPRPTKASVVLLSVYQAARAAGATFESDSAEEIVRQLMGGVQGTGSFSDAIFQAPEFSREELESALYELRLVDGVLVGRDEKQRSIR